MRHRLLRCVLFLCFFAFSAACSAYPIDVEHATDHMDTLQNNAEPADNVDGLWTEQEILTLADAQDWTVIDCAVVSDHAYDYIGVVLFEPKGTVDSDGLQTAFVKEDGSFSVCGIQMLPAKFTDLRYCGNGAVIFQAQTEDGTPFKCRITCSRSEEEMITNYVIETESVKSPS